MHIHVLGLTRSRYYQYSRQSLQHDTGSVVRFSSEHDVVINALKKNLLRAEKPGGLRHPLDVNDEVTHRPDNNSSR